jgi:hypothetical protein
MLFVLAAGYATAGDLVVNAKNQFKAGDQTFPAGNYRISSTQAATQRVISIRNLDTGAETTVRYITRISPRGSGQGSVVFDVFQGERYLAEIYFPREDGFHLQGAPGEHTHDSSPASGTK